jgi:DNA-binding transcriptional regulator GbsR (MarR family)
VDQDKRAEYVERWARVLEAEGQPRIAGRVFAHLATATEPHLSLQELADQLGVSRASISTNTRRLIMQGMVMRVAVPGSRGEHYAVDTGSTEGMLARAAQAARALEALATEGLELQPDVLTPGTQMLRQMVTIHRQLAASLEQVSTTSSSRKHSTQRRAR